MVTVRQRYHKFEAKVRVPKEHQSQHGGKQHLYRTLDAADLRQARILAKRWETEVQAGWQGLDIPPEGETKRRALREAYQLLREQVGAGEFLLHADGVDAVEGGIDHEIDKLADAVGERELTPLEEARLAALQDSLRIARGETVAPRRALEPSFRELADDYLDIWRTGKGRKVTNTEQQKVATYDLFAGFWGDKPIRGVRKPDAAGFRDALARLDPNWARSPRAKTMGWAGLQKAFGGKATGLGDSTLNRHMAALQALWEWASERGHCEGNNPFKGFHRRLKAGENAAPYLAWEPQELVALFNPSPRRDDLREIMLVALFTGMRLNEIASLTRGQIRERDGVRFVHVTDAKTSAGIRDVPLHRALHWLAARGSPDSQERVWPSFNPEGPGGKPGADAGREFSRVKVARGFPDRRKAFHSFRKNVVGQLERAGVLENVVAQLVGHEKHFTFRRYGAGVGLDRLSAAINLLAYPELEGLDVFPPD